MLCAPVFLENQNTLHIIFDQKISLLHPTRRQNVVQQSVLACIGTRSILENSPWDSTAILIFCCRSLFAVISRFPLKTGRPFLNFLAVLPHPTLYKVETRKKFWIHASNIVCGVWGGGGWTCVNWKTPHK